MEKTSKKEKNQRDRFRDYTEWIKEPQQKEKLSGWLEKAGVPLELRTMTTLEGQGYRCSPFHCKDLATGKYRELDIYAWKSYGRSFSVCGCEVAFDIVILAECKYAHYTDFLAFERIDKHLPTFPVVFEGRDLFGAPYQDFEFPIIISNLGYLEKCLGDLNKGLDKMVTYVNTLLKNNPKALAAEVLRSLYFENTTGKP